MPFIKSIKIVYTLASKCLNKNHMRVFMYFYENKIYYGEFKNGHKNGKEESKYC